RERQPSLRQAIVVPGPVPIFDATCDPDLVKVSSMQTRSLGKTGLKLSLLSFGASSLGQEFRPVTLDEAIRSVQVALDCGLNFIETSPFYVLCMAEVLL